MTIMTEAPPLATHYTAGGRRALARVASDVRAAARSLAEECTKVIQKEFRLDNGRAWHNDASNMLALAQIVSDKADALRGWGRPVPKSLRRSLHVDLNEDVPGLLAEIGAAVERGDLHAAKLVMGTLRFNIESMEGLGA